MWVESVRSVIIKFRSIWSLSKVIFTHYGNIKYRLCSFQHLKTVSSSILPGRPQAPLLNMYPVRQFHQRSCSFLSMPSAVFSFAHFGSSIKNDLPFPSSVKELFISQGLSRRLSQLRSWLKPQSKAFLLKELGPCRVSGSTFFM